MFNLWVKINELFLEQALGIMMKSFKKIIGAVLLSQLIWVIACQDVTDELAGVAPKDVDTLVIKMIPKSSGNPVFVAAKKGALDAAKNLSEKYKKLEVIVDWEAPKSEAASDQAALIRAAVKDSVDAIVVSCSDSDSLTLAINEAVDSGIPVMTFDSDCPASKRFAFYGPDDVEMGKELMNYLAEQLNGKGKIAILGGNHSAPNLKKRIEGIKQAAKQYKGIEIVAEVFHPETEDAAIAAMDSILSIHPDLNGWAMVGSWALFGDKLLNKIEPGKIKIVAVDALPVELKYIEKNYVQVLLGQPTFKWGKISVETVVNKLYLKQDVDEKILMKTIPVTIENLGGWSRQLRAWGYKNIPEEYLPL